VSQETLNKGLFITGTDTGVGKTLVTAGLVRYARKLGIGCVAVKPVETGCVIRAGSLFPEDGAFLRQASGEALSLDECAPYRFSIPASPARAAAMEGSRLFVSDLVEHVLTVSDSHDLVVVEGAGGLMVPIEEKLMMIDLVERLGYPVVLVAKSGLGTINHTLLSVEALRQREIDIAGIVLSSLDQDSGPEEPFTPRDIARLVKDVPVPVLPHLDPEIVVDPDKISQVMAEACGEHLTYWLYQAKGRGTDQGESNNERETPAGDLP
jgi:dethiobiotin synthetase